MAKALEQNVPVRIDKVVTVNDQRERERANCNKINGKRAQKPVVQNIEDDLLFFVHS